MLYKNIELAIRRLRKEKIVNLINILGLSIGITSFLLIVNYLDNETSYDDFHRNGDRIYRVESKIFENNNLTDHWATSPMACATALRNELTGIEDLVRITVQRQFSENIVSTGDIHYREYGCCFTDPSFFQVFSFKLIKGDPAQALLNPNKVVITQQMAYKYFGNEDPMGKILKFNCERTVADCEVTGILQNIPGNSHIKFDFFISWTTLPEWIREFWPTYGAYTYALLNPAVTPESIQQQFSSLSAKYSGLARMTTKNLQLSLVPLRDIHLNQKRPFEIEQKGSRSNSYVLSGIALAILFIAWFNYVNLSTALAFENLKEYTIRKVVGASTKKLLAISFTDSLLTTLIASILALVSVYFCFPVFNKLIGENQSFQLFFKSEFWLVLIVIILLGIVITGMTPIFLIRKINPSNLINKRGIPIGRENLRKALVCFQFIVSISLIAVTLYIFKQIHFMQNQPTGYNANQTMVIKFPGATENYFKKIETFNSEIRSLPSVKASCLSGFIPGMEVNNYSQITRPDVENPKIQLIQFYTLDFDFISMYSLKMKAGRELSKLYGNDKEKLMINEEAVKFFGYSSAEEAIGKILVIDSEVPMEIAGVVRNFHQESLDKAFLPIVFIYQGTIWYFQSRFISVKVSGEIESTIKELSTRWRKIFPESSFDYFFVDEFFNQQYQSNIRFGEIFGVFSSLTIFIACLGLFTLSLFGSRQKTKEVGIRKINGAKISEILIILNREFIILVIIAFFIAVPVSWYVMNKWIQSFAYKTELRWWIFALAGLLAVFIALFTVSWQSWRAAKRNPVDALRYE